MTYKQIETIERYIKAIDEIAVENHNIGKDYYEKATLLDNKIRSCVEGYNPSISWNSTSTFDSNYNVTYYPYRITDCLQVMRACLEGLLSKIPDYPLICELRGDIQKSESANEDDKDKIIIEMITKYSSFITFDKSTQSFTQKRIDGAWYEDDTIIPIYNAVLGKMKLLLSRLPFDKNSGGKNPTASVNVYNNNQNSQSQSMEFNLSISVEECFKALDDCETLEESDISMLKSQISEIQELLKDKKGKKRSIKEKISEVLKWIADKGTDVMIAILPTLIAALNGIK